MDKSMIDTPSLIPDDFCTGGKYAVGAEGDTKLLDVLPEWVRPIADNYSESKQFPAIYTFGAILGAVSSAVGKRLKTNFCEGSSCIYPALWLVLVGKSGTGKSPAMQDFLRPIIDKDNEGYEQNGKDHKKVIIDDATPAAVLRELRQGHGHTANWDEIVGKIEKSIKEVGYTDQLMSIHDHRSVNVDRRGGKDDEWADNHFVVKEPCLAICGTTQTDRWQRVFGAEQHLNSGFSHRFLFAYSDLNRDDSEEESPRSGKPIGNDMSMWADRLMSIFQLTASPTDSIFLRFSSEADAYLSQFCRTELTEYKRMMLRGGIPTEGISKLKADILRLAMLYWCLDWMDNHNLTPTITSDQMASACKSAIVCLRSFIHLVSLTRCVKPNKDETSLQAILTNVRSGMTVAESAQAISMGQSTAYKVLQRNGYAPDGTSLNENTARPFLEQVILDADWCKTQADRFYESDAIKLRSAIRQMDEQWRENGKNDHPSVQEYKSHIYNSLVRAKKDNSLDDYLLDYMDDAQADADYISNLLWDKTYKQALADDDDRGWDADDIAQFLEKVPHGQYYDSAIKTYDWLQANYADKMESVLQGNQDGDKALYTYLIEDILQRCTPYTEAAEQYSAAQAVGLKIIQAFREEKIYRAADALYAVCRDYPAAYEEGYPFDAIRPLREHCEGYSWLSTIELAKVLSQLGLHHTPVHQLADSITNRRASIRETINKYYPSGNYPAL